MTHSDSRVMDANSVALGTDVLTLMENAGDALADVLSEFPGKIVFVCGNGNNGGDGFAAASHFNDCKVLLLKPEDSIRSDAARHFYSKIKDRSIAYSTKELEGCDILVDCALGTGICGSVKEPYLSFIEDSKGFNGKIVSADVPSGIGTGASIKPDITVTFHDIKEGMTSENSGSIIIADIGIPKKAVELVGPGDLLRYPIPGKESHKGMNGRLLIIGGGPYSGAPAMCGLAALRVGVDLVRIASPSHIFPIVSSFSPVFVMTELKGDVLSTANSEILLKLAEKVDAILIGPGLGTATDTVGTVKFIETNCNKPMVIDADGLNALGNGYRCHEGIRILTPHSQEFARLGGRSPEEMARSMGAIILKTGPEDIITDGTRTRRNVTGNPGMTGAGTGDVLAGIVAGLLSKGMEGFDAACLGAYISGKAGDLAFSERSYGLIATDVIDNIGKILPKG